MTQAEVAEKARYGTGGAVAISRVENGRQRPTPEKFAGIADALGLTLEELEAKAVAESTEGDDLGGGEVPPPAKELRQRALQLQDEIDRRTEAIESHVEAFDAEHKRAQEEFFMRFVKVADRIDGAEPPVAVEPNSRVSEAAGQIAENRIGLASTGIATLLSGSVGGAAAAGGGLAYGAFVTAASMGTAPTGALLWGAPLAAGGAGMSGGIAVLAGVVAFPMTVLAAGGVLLMSKRNRRQRGEFDAKLCHAEQELAASEKGFESFLEALRRGTETLHYIATHAGHALVRWSDQRSETRCTWAEMGVDDHSQYQAFVEVAGAQISVATVDYRQLLTSSGAELDELKEVVGELLERAADRVGAHV